MTVLAFLQNMWVRNPAEANAMIQRNPNVRRRLIKYSLFAGCLTGRRLKSALGPWCDKIIWDELSPVIDNNPKTYHPPDVDHIQKVLSEVAPDLIICFSRRGLPKLKPMTEIKIIDCPHPAARQPTVAAELHKLRLDLDELAL